MKGEQQYHLGIWETDGRVVTALADLCTDREAWRAVVHGVAELDMTE